MKIYLAGFLFLAAAELLAVTVFFTGCASHKLAAHDVREAIQKKRPSPPARPQFTQVQRDSAASLNKARAAASAAKALKVRAEKAEADSLRIVSHTQCPVTEIPKVKRGRARRVKCPDGCEGARR